MQFGKSLGFLESWTIEMENKIIKNESLGLTLTKNEIKDIVKVIKSLENRGILLKVTTENAINHEGGLLNFVALLLKTGLPSTKNVLAALAKHAPMPLGLSAAASAADAGTHKKILGLRMTKLLFSNEESDDIMKIVKSLEDCCLLIKGVSETIENELKEQKREFVPSFSLRYF